MPNYTETVPSSRSPEDTFDYMARFSNVAEWDPACRRARDRQDGGPVGVGSSFDLDFEMLGRETELHYEIVEYEPPHRVVLVARTNTFESVDKIVVEPRGATSAVTYDATVTLKGVFRLATPLMSLGFQRAGKQAGEGLRERLAG
jgi:hypothetical protein